MTATLTPSPIQQFFDDNGVPLVGGLLFTYAAGTLTKLQTYADSTGATEQTDPIVLNNRGEPEGTLGQSLGIWLLANTAYKFVLAPAGSSDPPTNPIWSLDQINSSSGATAAGQTTFATLAAAVAASIAAGTTTVSILGYYAAGDGGGGTYVSATAGAGPGKFQSADGAWWKLSGDVLSVNQFGAKNGDLSFDSAAAITAALQFGAGTITLNSGGYRSSTGQLVPAGVTFIGTDFLPGIPATGTLIQFDLSVAICVSVLDGNSNNTAAARGFAITRAAGAIPAGSVGLKVWGGYNIQVRDIYSIGHAICHQFLNTPNGGISCYAENIFSAIATDVHIEMNAWPELSIIGSRFGSNGTNDVACNGYVRITGGTGGADGPNTLKVTNCQFNQGAASPQYGIIFAAMSGSSGADYTFTNSYFENFSIAGITSDATVSSLARLKMAACGWNVVGGSGALPMFALNAATQVVQWNLVGNQFFCTDFTLTPTAQFIGVSIVGNFCNGTGHFVAPSGSTITLASNTWGGSGLIVAGAGGITIVGDVLTAGSLDTSAMTGPLLVQSSAISGARAWTPTVLIGGASTGITYATQAGTYEYLTGDTVRLNFSITLTSKGALTGAVAVGGLPVPANSAWGGSELGGIANYILTSLTGAPYVTAQTSSTVLLLGQSTSSGTGTVTNSNLSNTSALQGSIIIKV